MTWLHKSMDPDETLIERWQLIPKLEGRVFIGRRTLGLPALFNVYFTMSKTGTFYISF